MSDMNDDPCRCCDHCEKDHRAPKSIEVGASGFSSGGTHQMLVTAKTHCYANALCSCTAYCGPERKADEMNFQCRSCRKCFNLQGIAASDDDLPDFRLEA